MKNKSIRKLLDEQEYFENAIKYFEETIKNKIVGDSERATALEGLRQARDTFNKIKRELEKRGNQ